MSFVPTLVPTLCSNWEQNISCTFLTVPSVPSVPTCMGAHVEKITPLELLRNEREQLGTGNKALKNRGTPLTERYRDGTRRV